jgi:hypothetical protein
MMQNAKYALAARGRTDNFANDSPFNEAQDLLVVLKLEGRAVDDIFDTLANCYVMFVDAHGQDRLKATVGQSQASDN